MKRKLLTLIAAVTALSVSAVGCSSSSSQDSQSSNVPVQTTDTESESAVSIVDFEPVTVVDNDDCSIVLTEIDANNALGFSVKAELENKSADKTYTFHVESAAINGASVNPFFSAEIAAGEKSDETISFSGTELEAYGVGNVTDIELLFTVLDWENLTVVIPAGETVHVYPYGEENAAALVRADQDSDTVLVDNDDVKVVVIGTGYDSMKGYAIYFYMENKTNQEAMFAIRKAVVNDSITDLSWAAVIAANKVGFGSAYLSDTALQYIEITDTSEISKIEIDLQAYNCEDYSAYPYVNDAYTIEIH